jgi:hypothetical protein
LSEKNLFSERLREPLNETTRKVRRNLMAASVIGVVLTKVGLIPSKILAFGVEFTSSNQNALMLLLAVSIAYFTISFVVYVYSELTAWQIVFSSKELEELKEAAEKNSLKLGRVPNEADKFREYIRKIHSKSKPTFYIRLIIELAIPLIFAIYSFYSLINHEVTTHIPIKQNTVSESNTTNTLDPIKTKPIITKQLGYKVQKDSEANKSEEPISNPRAGH